MPKVVTLIDYWFLKIVMMVNWKILECGYKMPVEWLLMPDTVDRLEDAAAMISSTSNDDRALAFFFSPSHKSATRVTSAGVHSLHVRNDCEIRNEIFVFLLSDPATRSLRYFQIVFGWNLPISLVSIVEVALCWFMWASNSVLHISVMAASLPFFSESDVVVLSHYQ